MGDLSRHFSRSEFACHCKNPRCEGKVGFVVDPLLIIGLEELRESIRRGNNRSHSRIRVRVISGVRCADHDRACNEVNKKAGYRARTNSTGQHFLGAAADVVVEVDRGPAWEAIPPEVVVAYAEECPVWQDGRGGIGHGIGNAVHLDVRGGKGARWNYASKGGQEKRSEAVEDR